MKLRAQVFPVTQDLDGDGKKDEAVVASCIGSREIDLRTLRDGIPQGQYRVT